jgi:hypothetical protein
MALPDWKIGRTLPRTTCDQCGGDYAATPERCKTVRRRTDPLYSQTVCLACVKGRGYTGFAWRQTPNGEEPAAWVLGRAVPPKGWQGQRTTPEEALQILADPGYAIPEPPKELERLKIQWAFEDEAA